MKKFTTFAVAFVLGSFAFAASAADTLGEGVPFPSNPVQTWGISDVTVTWPVNGVDQEINWAGENHNVTVIVDGTSYNIEAELMGFNSGIGPMADTDSDPDAPVTNTLAINFYEQSKDGQYKTCEITIPAGLVKNNAGATNPEQTIEYFVYQAVGQSQFEVWPEAGESYDESLDEGYVYDLTSFGNVMITFPGEIMPVDRSNKIVIEEGTLYESDGWSWVEYEPLTNGYFDYYGDTMYIEIPMAYVKPGIFRVVVPQGFVTWDDSKTNSEINLVYIVEGLTILTGPENYGTYSTQNLPDFVNITWNFKEVELNPEATVVLNYYERTTYEDGTVVLPAAALQMVYIAPGQSGGEPEEHFNTRAESYNALHIEYLKYLPENVVYPLSLTLELPEGLLLNGENESPEQIINFDVYGISSRDADFSLDAQNGLLSVTWGDDVEVGDTYYNLGEGQPVYISDEQGDIVMDLEFTGYFYLFDWETEQMSDDYQVTNLYDPEYFTFIGLLVNFENIDLADGNYTIWIPTGFVTIDPLDYSYSFMEFNEAASYNFKVEDGVVAEGSTAINAIAPIQEVLGGVYNLQGVKVADGIEGLRNLNKGIYIINGKKVLVK